MIPAFCFREWIKTASALSAVHDDVMPMPMLNTWYNSVLRHAAFGLEIWKIGGMSHDPLRMTASQFFGSTRGMLSTKPPPVMWASPLIDSRLSRCR